MSSRADEQQILTADLYVSCQPIIRRIANQLRTAPVGGRRGSDDIELIVKETFFVIVNDVLAGRADSAVGAMFERVLHARSAREFRRYLRARAHGADRIAIVTSATAAIGMGLSLERPHAIRIHHRLSLDTRIVGPFGDALEALTEAERLEADLQARDQHWEAVVVPLLPLDRTSNPKDGSAATTG